MFISFIVLFWILNTQKIISIFPFCEILKKKEYDEALKSFENFLTAYRVSNVPVTDETSANVKHKIGLIFLEHKMEYEKAIKYFKNAVTARSLCLGDEHIDVMVCIIPVGWMNLYILHNYLELIFSYNFACLYNTEVNV